MEERKAKLTSKYFPRARWTDEGPVRRAYLARTTDGAGVLETLDALARREGFTAPGDLSVTGGPDETLAALLEKEAGADVGIIFGTSLRAHWCDICAEPAEPGWAALLVRTELGENLLALANAEGLLEFRAR